jgi:hypothetical protein
MDLSAKGGSLNARKSIALLFALVATAALAVGCGSGGSSTSAPASTTTAGATSTAAEEGPEPSGGETPPSEAQAAATGDIPDNQVFLLYREPKTGYSIRYPEGWARKGSGADVTFQEKANAIHLTVHKGSSQSGSKVKKTTFTQQSAPDPVTGKRLKLITDRYEYPHGGQVAILELSTPEGVDNVDAYRMISESFKWLR